MALWMGESRVLAKSQHDLNEVKSRTARPEGEAPIYRKVFLKSINVPNLAENFETWHHQELIDLNGSSSSVL